MTDINSSISIVVLMKCYKKLYVLGPYLNMAVVQRDFISHFFLFVFIFSFVFLRLYKRGGNLLIACELLVDHVSIQDNTQYAAWTVHLFVRMEQLGSY